MTGPSGAAAGSVTAFRGVFNGAVDRTTLTALADRATIA